ncbi:hypothetical protein [Helicobacter canis]|uniref:Uncharacterized protein n=1 Tax=Helicobacter canis TaxID=29419 RepID=A0A377J623_9HELI|nr:hypothetical protein [Helicobacter canis]STO97911.1 Uncharacterised protein [Helicobacter canis]
MIKLCKQIVSSAFSSSYNAKMFMLFLGYVVVLAILLPSALEMIDTRSLPASSPLESTLDPALESTFLQYFYLVFLPFIGAITLYAENFIGILVLFFALILSDRLKIFQHYVLLLLLYLLCAYPSLVSSDLVPGFHASVLEALALLSNENYAMLFALYGGKIVWVFLALAVFEWGFYYFKRLEIPRVVWENLGFVFVLYVVVFGIYSYDSKSLVLY